MKRLINSWRLVTFCGCCVLLSYGLFRPLPPPEFFDQSDKLQHLLAFAGLALTCRMAFPQVSNRLFWTLILPLAPLLEWLQHVLQPLTRNFSLNDALANFAGLMLAGVIWQAFMVTRRQKAI